MNGSRTCQFSLDQFCRAVQRAERYAGGLATAEELSTFRDELYTYINGVEHREWLRSESNRSVFSLAFATTYKDLNRPRVGGGSWQHCVAQVNRSLCTVIRDIASRLLARPHLHGMGAFRVLVAGPKHFTGYPALDVLLSRQLPDVELLTCGGPGVGSAFRIPAAGSATMPEWLIQQHAVACRWWNYHGNHLVPPLLPRRTVFRS